MVSMKVITFIQIVVRLQQHIGALVVIELIMAVR